MGAALVDAHDVSEGFGERGEGTAMRRLKNLAVVGA
jgi:hypothetical protein